jgi:hypothetical protein
MPLLVVLAALGSIVATAALTWVLWRLNKPPNEADRTADATPEHRDVA